MALDAKTALSKRANDETTAADAVVALPKKVIEGALLQRFEHGSTLTADELDELGRVTHIGDNFLDGCRGITAIDLSPLRNVMSIDSGFLIDCNGLAQLDLSPLRNVTNVGSNCLHGCTGLRQIDLSTMCNNVTSVGDGFLGGCSGLTQIDLSPLSNVTTVGHSFVRGCTGLTRVDLSPLRNVTRVGYWFLANCSGLTELASSPLAKKLCWNGGNRYELAQLLAASNKQRIAEKPISWHARRMALRIRNFAPRDRASDAFKVWNVMRCVVRFLSPLRVPDAVLIAEEARMVEVVGARSDY